MTDRLPRLLLHAEGAAVALAAVTLYFHEGFDWWLLLVLALAPDLAMLGYLAGARAGAVCLRPRRTPTSCPSCSQRPA